MVVVEHAWMLLTWCLIGFCWFVDYP